MTAWFLGDPVGDVDLLESLDPPIVTCAINVSATTVVNEAVRRWKSKVTQDAGKTARRSRSVDHWAAGVSLSKATGIDVIYLPTDGLEL
jgi:hypothetical protein